MDSIHQYRKIVTISCEVCGAHTEGLTTKRFCSDACKMKNFRQNKENKMKYQTLQYNEFDMEKAIIDYHNQMSVSALEIATKHNVPVSELHKEYAKFRAKKG